MAAKRRSLLSPKIRRHLEEALLEALKRHIGSHAGGESRHKKTPARKKKAGKKRAGRRHPARPRRRRA